jgi:ketosteroid isomerase-like protein
LEPNLTSDLGDPMPAQLAAYYTDLDAGRMEEAVEHFSTDIVFALPPADGDETGPRRLRKGRDQLLGWFEERGSQAYVHRVQLCVADSAGCLLEGVGVDSSTGESFATFVASVQLDDDGLVGRYLSYMTTPAVVPAPSGTGSASADAAAVLARYFEALDAGAFDEAADQFSADVVYSHPPYRHTGIDSDDRLVFRGRDVLRAAFTARGKQRFDHRVVAIGQRGPHCLLEGMVEGLPGGRNGSFVSSLTLDGDGLVQRYVSFYCEPAVPRR